MTKKPLHDLLCELLGSENCYFSPPASIQMKFPAIRYYLSGDYSIYADDLKFKKHKQYTVMVIDPDPDSEMPERVGSLPYCKLNRTYVADGLNHYVFTLYFSGQRYQKKEEIENG